tara:strand:+ start:90 stop:926 length:837 start_codon:yes stop_codon:yes gene_type:complete
MFSSSTSEDFEMTVANINPCFAFKIPPRKGGQGYRAAEWKANKVWEGRLQVATRGSEIGIKLVEEDGGTFAEAPVGAFAAPFVEPVVDSGRYFALRIVNAGRFAFIGIGFAERGHALSFKIALQEHFKREAEPALPEGPIPEATGKYKLGAGGSIGKISVAGLPARTKKKKKASSGGLGLGLAPPPSAGRRGLGLGAPPAAARRRGGGKKKSAARPVDAPAAAGAAPSGDLMGLMADFGSIAVAAPAAAAAASAAAAATGFAPPKSKSQADDPFGGLF